MGSELDADYRQRIRACHNDDERRRQHAHFRDRHKVEQERSRSCCAYLLRNLRGGGRGKQAIQMQQRPTTDTMALLRCDDD